VTEVQLWQAIFAAILVSTALIAQPKEAGASTVGAQTAAPVAATAPDAVRQAVQAAGATYAGDCAAARSPEDLGKICSRLVTERNGVDAYMTGRTFSEFDSWLFVGEVSGGWCILAAAPLDAQTMAASIPWPSQSGSVPAACQPVKLFGSAATTS
jgi:hypothetical protein